jgi:hypothetical protein
MQINPTVSQYNGIISVKISCVFVGAITDVSDRQLISAYGDPQINVAGTFTDPSNPVFTFAFPTTQLYLGVTSQLSSQVANFMLALPGPSNPNQPSPIQGPLDCVTTNPREAADAWYAIMCTSIQNAMTALRAQTLIPTLNPVTV